MIFSSRDVGEHGVILAFEHSPIAMPATWPFIGTPASISERQPPQTEAIDEEPFDSVISETTRSV